MKEDRQMRVLFLSNAPSPYFHDFCELLGKKLNLTVIYERRLLGNRDLSWGRAVAGNYRAVYLKGRPVRDEMAFCPEVIRHLKQERFDLVVLHDYLSPTGMLASLYMRKYHIPFAIHADGGVKKEKEPCVRRFLKRFFASGACAYFSSGRVTDEYFTYYGADARRILRYPFTSVHEGDILQRPLSESEKRRLRGELGLERQLCDARLLLYVGSIMHGKGVDLLLRCAQNTGKRAEFLIVGGESTAEMEQWMKCRGVTNVTFRGFEPPERIKRYMRCADLFVFPTRHDNWGLVVNEAMAAGLPVITTDQCVAGMELIENGNNGLLISADDVNALTEGVFRMISQPESKLSEIGKINLEKIRAYSLEQMAQAYREHLIEIVKGFNKSRI